MALVPRVGPREMVKGKVVVLGGRGVGKTSIVTRVLGGKFSPQYRPTSGFEVRQTKGASVDGQEVDLIIWEVAGALPDFLISNTRESFPSCAVLVADATNYASFAHLQELVAVYDPFAARRLLINKFELLEKDYCKTLRVDFPALCSRVMFVSAKNGRGIKRLKRLLCTDIAEAAEIKDAGDGNEHPTSSKQRARTKRPS